MGQIAQCVLLEEQGKEETDLVVFLIDEAEWEYLIIPVDYYLVVTVRDF